MPQDAEKPAAATAHKGFTEHGRRNLLELGGFLVALALLLLGGRACLGWSAERAAMKLPPEVDARIGELASDEQRVGAVGQRSPPGADRVDRQFEAVRAGLRAEESAMLLALELHVAPGPVNAYALPGGQVYVLGGLIERTEGDDDALAGVLAHELGHAVRRHGVRLAAREAALSVALAALLGDLDGTIQALALGASSLDQLDHSREMEDEADAFAVELLARIGRDAEGLARFLEQLESQPVPELLSTHPDPGERAKTIRALARK